MTARYLFKITSVPEGVTLEAPLAVPGVFPLKRDRFTWIVPVNAGWIVERELKALGVGYSVETPLLPRDLKEFPPVPNLRTEWLSKITGYQKDALRWAVPRDSVLLYWPPGSGKTLECLMRAQMHNGLTIVSTLAVARLHWTAEIAKYTTESSLIVGGGIDRLYSPFVAKPVLPTEAWKGRAQIPVQVAEERRGIAAWKTVAAAVKAGAASDGEREAKTATVRVLVGLVKSAKKWEVLWRDVKLEYGGRGAGYSATPKLETVTPAPKYLVVGWESLADHADWLSTLKPEIWIADEIHAAKSSKRMIAVPRTIDKIVTDPETGEEKTVRAPDIDETTGQQKCDFIKRTNRSASAKLLSEAVKIRIGATATPIRDRVRDLWSQLDLIFPFQYGMFRSFGYRYCSGKATNYSTFDTSGISNPDELTARLTFDFHVLPKSVTHAGLPPKRREFRYLEPEELRDLTREEIAEFKREMASSGGRPARVAEIRLAMAAAQKRDTVVAMIVEAMDSGQKVVVFVERKREVEALRDAVAKKLKKLPRGATVWGTHGDDSAEQREDYRVEFMQHPGPCAFIATGDSMGTAIDLNSCDLHIIAQLPWNHSQIDQREGRTWRRGSDRPVIVRYVIARDTRDTEVAATLLEKLPQVVAINSADTDAKEVRAALAQEGKTVEELDAELLSKLSSIVDYD